MRDRISGGGGALFKARARWICAELEDSDGAPLRSPRHQTLRRRGAAPEFPKPTDLAGAHSGGLLLYPDCIVLTRDDAATALTIYGSSIERRVFYRNAVEILHAPAQRTLISLAENDAELADLMMQAYL